MPPDDSPPSPVSGGGAAHTRLLQHDLLARIEARLTEVPESVELRVERSHLLANLDRGKEAAAAYREAVKARPARYPVTTRAYSILPFSGDALPITVLLLVPPEWGNAPFRKYLDPQIFLTLQIITDFHDPGLALPPHQMVINCISDADACAASLEAATALIARTSAPAINLPAEVLKTGRESNARRMASIPGVRTPAVATLARRELAGDQAAAILASRGFQFPLLLRSLGFHTGAHFVRVESAQEIPAALENLPGDHLVAIEFVDVRNADGQVRKYRVMIVDGKLYPVHAAISPDWKVHHFNSGMEKSPEHRAEEKEFLEEMPRVLGASAVEALQRVASEMKLDYAGVDFSVESNGEIVFFEGNATMNVEAPGKDDKMWSYRRKAIDTMAHAVRTMLISRAFSWRDPSISAEQQVLRDVSRWQIEAREKGQFDLIEQARRLIDQERFHEAKDIYLGVLTRDPTHLIALNNLAALFNMMGFNQSALKVYREVGKLDPNNARGRLNLAHTSREAGELDEARGHYEAVLRLTPEEPEAHKGIAHVLLYQGETEAAWEHHRKWVASRPPRSRSATAQPKGIPILTLASPCGGNSPVLRLIDRKIFDLSGLVPDFIDPAEPLPPHRLALNLIGDVDHCGISLQAANRLLEKTDKPVLNPPSRIQRTGRAGNAELLGALQDVVTARMITLPRETLSAPDGASVLKNHGLTFPLLLRTPGFHEGRYFVRVEKPDELADAAAKLPGRELLAIQYLDARGADGKIHKFRVMMVDGKLYPLHQAISSSWMIHYYSAEMAHSPEHRAEEAKFLEDMPAVLGPTVRGALGRIRDALGLDYAGADFSIGPDGRVLLFEANATMTAPEPDVGTQWDYRRPAVQKIRDAVQEMLRTRAGF